MRGPLREGVRVEAPVSAYQTERVRPPRVAMDNLQRRKRNGRGRRQRGILKKIPRFLKARATGEFIKFRGELFFFFSASQAPCTSFSRNRTREPLKTAMYSSAAHPWVTRRSVKARHIKHRVDASPEPERRRRKRTRKERKKRNAKRKNLPGKTRISVHVRLLSHPKLYVFFIFRFFTFLRECDHGYNDSSRHTYTR